MDNNKLCQRMLVTAVVGLLVLSIYNLIGALNGQ